MRFATIFAALTAFATPFIIFPRHEPGWVSRSEVVAQLLFLPIAFASVILILSALLGGALRRPFGEATVVLCLALIFPSSIGLRIAYLSNSRKNAAAERERRDSWYRYDDILIPHIISYVTTHPSRVSHPSKDDRAQIVGLGDYLRNKGVAVKTEGDMIIDPWGQPIWIVMDHDGDMVLRFDDFLYGVWAPHGNKLVVALFTKQQDPGIGPSLEKWQLEGGQIKNQ